MNVTIQLTDLEKKLAEQLLITVKNNEPFLTYKEIAGKVNPPIYWRNLGSHLGNISKLCYQLGLPLLSAKVINGSTKIAGKGFYGLCESLGKPIEGKTEEQLYKAERDAIRKCKEWYKFEEYLGLNVGLSKPVDHKFLDVRKPQYYQYNIDILNNCFNLVLGKTYDGYMKGSKPFEVDSIGYAVWFPKLSVDGTPGAKYPGWINVLSDDGKIIEEYGAEKSFDPSNRFIFVFAKKGSEPYFFRGVFKLDIERSSDEHRYYYKVADTADLHTSVPLIHLVEDELQRDNDLIFDLQKEAFDFLEDKFEYAGKPLPVPEPQKTKGRIVYPRDRKKLVNALVHARFVCELNSKHPTFTRKSSGRPYTEPHHLVPMSAQECFEVSLDVEENIVSLCSNCHNHIHYGVGADKLLKQLYEQRKDALRSVGIIVTEEELLSFYS